MCDIRYDPVLHASSAELQRFPRDTSLTPLNAYDRATRYHRLR
jgi:hypothetical protein